MLRFTDSCDAYAVTADLTKKWSTVDATYTFDATGGRFGGGCISNAGGGGGGKVITFRIGTLSSGDNAEGFYFKAASPPASEVPIFQRLFVGGGACSQLTVNTSGFVGAWTYNLTSMGRVVLGNINVCDGNYHWIECRDTGAACTLYVDNIPQGSAGTNGGGNSSYFQFVSLAGILTKFDDPLIYDNAAGAPTTTSNFPLGARQLSIIRPASDGTIQFATTSSGSTHFNLVNETVPDGDTSYVQDSTVGNQDLFNMSALGYTPAVITGAMVNLYVDNPNGGTINIQGICKSGATQANATAIQAPLIYQTEQYPFTVDPNTSAAWTPSGLASAQFGFKNA